MDSHKESKAENIFPLVIMGSLFILIDGLALLAVYPFEAAGSSVFENPSEPFNLVYLFSIILIFTAAILIISRFLKRLVQVIMLGSVGFLSFDVFIILLINVIPEFLAFSLSIVATAILIILLIIHPEWYVIDASGIVVSVGSIAMLGISLSVPLVIVMLIGMALYDAISVYKTKHMVDLADVVLGLRVPAMFVIPKTRGYSFIKEKESLKEQLSEGKEREAFFLGLGDVVFPGMLVTSTYFNIEVNGLLIALSVIFGILVGFAALARSTAKGNPQAGLPYLCTGAIIGYLLSSYIFG